MYTNTVVGISSSINWELSSLCQLQLVVTHYRSEQTDCDITDHTEKLPVTEPSYLQKLVYSEKSKLPATK